MLLMKYKKKRKLAKKILPGTLYDVQKEKIKMVDRKLETLNAQGTDHVKHHFFSFMPFKFCPKITWRVVMHNFHSIQVLKVLHQYFLALFTSIT